VSTSPLPSPAPARRSRNRRGEGDRLRADIVATATELLEATGSPEAVTLRAVARHIGIAAPSIYAHFPDRDAMHEAVRDAGFVDLIDQLDAATAGTPESEPVRSLHLGCRTYLRFAEDRPNLYRFLFGPEVKAGPGTADGQPAGGHDLESGLRAFQILVDGITACADQGRSASTEPWTDATNLWVALHGLALLHDCVPLFPWPERGEQVDQLVRSLGRLQP
jgi:AcrR family transcriptional regulator